MDRLRVLIIGGYGTFGGRLVDLLADDAGLTLFVAGRSKDKAERFCAERTSGADIVPLVFDREGDVDAQLAAAKPDLVIDASGPFQIYGSRPYRVVTACLRHGIDYLDLADGAEFVAGIRQFDTEAQKRGVVLLSGVSSFPVLTAAVIDALAPRYQRIVTVVGGIAPSPYAGVGMNVIRAIASYAGQPVALVRNGRPATGHAFTDTMRYTIAPPGRLPLRSIRFSLVDVPDLKVLPDIHPTIGSVWMGAGPVPEILHRVLNGLAWLVRLRIIPSLSPFAGLFYRVTNLVRWGEHRGGMFVQVEGIAADGSPLKSSWHLLAEGDDGPLIPSMAAEAIVRQRLSGARAAPGARPAAGEVALPEYDARFARRDIWTGWRSGPEDRQSPLYRTILGNAWTAMPAPLRAIHDVRSRSAAKGNGSIHRGEGRLARWVARAMKLPESAADVPVFVTFDAREGRETWRRTFGDATFSSVQKRGSGRADRLVEERFGMLTFGLALVLDRDRLSLVLRRWRFFALPLPMFLAPDVEAFEYSDNGIFHFYVKVSHFLTGPIIAYAGWLEPVEDVDAPGDPPI